MTLDLDRFLARIGYDGPRTPAAGALAAIQWTHLLNVPFENLDIALLRRPISLEVADLEGKIVGEWRGGFCFELNGLLAAALAQLGYRVELASARWPSGETGELGPPFDHLVLLVAIPGEASRWLVDVAGGRQAFARPLRLAAEDEQTHPETGLTYRLVHEGGRDWRVEWRAGDDPWSLHYALDAGPYRLADFAGRCAFHQTSRDSVFTQGALCSRTLPDGRVKIARDRLILTRAGERFEEELDGPEAVRAALRTWFGMALAFP